MAVLEQSVYLTIADQYAAAREQMLLSRVHMYNSVREIVDLTGEVAVDPEVDLLMAFWNSYLGAGEAMNSPAYFMGAVRAINSHAIARSEYASVDAYLVAYNADYTVPYFWCELSGLAGFTLPPVHCESPPTWYTG